ncbi:hypothetical protein DFJ43DRAFT_1224321 [Lentinula guzmanii]|uniref:Uncharacterized protein n=1 Tax=Lentinula guzmanii TaxID=2804957 RepID=A0AA38J9H7_9AGAR|nr:hypothetical protein DFJ43DRAFT_1224321 [Lentinula guzmanii]
MGATSMTFEAHRPTELTSKSHTDFDQIKETTPANEQIQESAETQHRHCEHQLAVFKQFRKLAQLKGRSADTQSECPLSISSDDNLLNGSTTDLKEVVETHSFTAIDAHNNTDVEDSRVLAVNIRELINVFLPVIPSLPLSDTSELASTSMSSPTFDDISRCLLPFRQLAIKINEKYLVDLLSDPTIMNDDTKKEQAPMRTILHTLASPNDQEDSDGGSRSIGKDGHVLTPSAAGASIMLYLPLQPQNMDIVQLAESQLVFVMAPCRVPSVSFTNTHGSEAANVSVHDTAGCKRKWWPFHHKRKSIQSQGCKSSSSPQDSSQETLVTFEDKVSIEATWWGYRIFLPPPVMSILDDKEITLVKRAALISTALTWLFANIPAAVFPPPLQPVLLLLQRIVPYVSYIGTFISWSWETIKGYDTGYGVILNATWLLPVAPVPGTWKVDSFPGATPTRERSNHLRTVADIPNATSVNVADTSAPLSLNHVDSSANVPVVNTPANGILIRNPLLPLIGSGGTRFVEALDEISAVITLPVVSSVQCLEDCEPIDVPKTELEVVDEKESDNGTTKPGGHFGSLEEAARLHREGGRPSAYEVWNLKDVMDRSTCYNNNSGPVLVPPPPMLLSTSWSDPPLSPLPLKLLNLEMLPPSSAICPPDTLSPLGEISFLKCFSPPASTPFRTDSEDFIDKSSASNERHPYENKCFVHCETMDKTNYNEDYTPQDPGLRNALQLSPEPDVVLSCWQTDFTFSFYDCVREASYDDESSTSHVCDNAPRQQIIKPIVAPSPVHSLQQWLEELEEMVDSLVEEDDY